MEKLHYQSSPEPARYYSGSDPLQEYNHITFSNSASTLNNPPPITRKSFSDIDLAQARKDLDEAKVRYGQRYSGDVPLIPEEAIEKPWTDLYNDMTGAAKKLKQRRAKATNDIKLKDGYCLDECLDKFKELENKQFGELYLTGSVALKLQNKISRDYFKDLDIIILGKYELDDDILDFSNGQNYDKNELLSESRSVVYSNLKVDIFSLEKSFDLKLICVDYMGKSYVCQDYRQIITAKLNMILPKMKDWKDLYGSVFDLNFF